jgi:tetratricopeptide (TPR) repeat protein
MRQLSLAVWLCFTLTPALAIDDTVVPPPPPAAPSNSDASLSPTETPEIVIPAAAPVEELIPVIQPDESAKSQLSVDQQALAAKKIAFFRSKVHETTSRKSFFSRLVSDAQRPIDIDLLLDMQRHVERFPDLPETPEVFHLMAQVHQRTDNHPAAAIDWLMLRTAYPNSTFNAEATAQLQELANDELKKHAPTLKTMTAQIEKLKGSRDERLAAMLILLGNNTEKDFASAIANACASFLLSNRSWLQEDVIEHALARQTLLLDPQVALYHFNKLLELYPSSTWRADSLLQIGSLQRKDLFDFAEAAKTYSSLIAQFPDSTETRQAYESLAAMYDEDLHDYPNALKTYEAVVARYKSEPIVLRALHSMANIQLNKSNQPAQAIASYLKIADIFKGKDGMDALLNAEQITLFTTRDWKKAIDINQRIIAFAPQSGEAIQARFNNADITENKLGTPEAARKLYAEFVAQFPNHSLSKDAKRRIDALNSASNKPSATPQK